jgi:hypothetical protein
MFEVVPVFPVIPVVLVVSFSPNCAHTSAQNYRAMNNLVVPIILSNLEKLYIALNINAF